MIFHNSRPKLTPLKAAINQAYHQNEDECVAGLLRAAALSEESLRNIQKQARHLVSMVRAKRLSKGGLDAFLYQYDLSSEEGIALMCLAEAMLRVPDNDTLDKLIRDKVTGVNWKTHQGKSESFFVNAATWGLMLTGKVLHEKVAQNTLHGSLKSLVGRMGEPVIRKAVGEAMKILGRQFVMGRTIEEGIERAAKREALGYRYSYDMLGEAARTHEDAERYFKAYQQAIAALRKAKSKDKRTLIERPGISIKLSALHPRYEFSQQHRVLSVMVQRLLALVIQAREANISVTVDAEEANRLEFSLEIIGAVFADPALEGWEGFGLAVQSYQKRAMPVLDWLIHLAREHKRRILVRLIKGAYWDSEIKHAQVEGLIDYPVFTRKASTDVSFIACAKKIANAKDAIYCQFATHNAYSVALVLEMMKGRDDFEFQCLHGMGRALYDDVVSGKIGPGVPCRVYAPVGNHQELLPYLVRRLLENGANSSFVNRIIDENASIEDLIADPVATVAGYKEKKHPNIPLPKNIYGPDRPNANGIELTDTQTLLQLGEDMHTALEGTAWQAGPMLAGKLGNFHRNTHPVIDPNDHRREVGIVTEGVAEDVEQALQSAKEAAPKWSETSLENRANALRKAADEMEKLTPRLMALLVREAGKTLPDAIAEVREAIDFCRYYAAEGLSALAPKKMPGPTGEINMLYMHGRGVMFCVSPWNFPLAIFVGQIAASLMAGNAVIAKPASQTALIAAEAVRILHHAGIPKAVLQLLPGPSAVVGKPLIADERVDGVLLTGSTSTARTIQRSLSSRSGPIVPLIAETGGQNAMIVDSTALPEQVVRDVIRSAFGSAGQRCSALRVLFVQSSVADKMLKMLKGAMQVLRIGDPSYLSTDIGPVIDDDAREGLERHVAYLENIGKLIYRVELPELDYTQHSFFAPQAFEIDSLEQLEEEVFGPILHVIRYDSEDLDNVIEAINNTGYGLTLGIHSRIQETVDYIVQRANVGNIYVNRNMIGAVVGVQPFGGEGLSGTGPKAGGPHYLLRLCKERTVTIDTTAVGGNASLMLEAGS